MTRTTNQDGLVTNKRHLRITSLCFQSGSGPPGDSYPTRNSALREYKSPISFRDRADMYSRWSSFTATASRTLPYSIKNRPAASFTISIRTTYREHRQHPSNDRDWNANENVNTKRDAARLSPARIQSTPASSLFGRKLGIKTPQPVGSLWLSRASLSSGPTVPSQVIHVHRGNRVRLPVSDCLSPCLNHARDTNTETLSDAHCASQK